ncbi:hypothetical protein [Neisseria lactamica]|uniref:hypothetical protein n=1 Tax=Neisseria lactamica TaxID=486 RepID=UPI0027E0C4A0|nr:hypothetical protein [Neisseria lactamica]
MQTKCRLKGFQTAFFRLCSGAEAETRIAGARKPYPSNIAKVLGGATLPEAIKRTENAAARQKLAELRRMLGGRAISRDNFYGYAQCLEFQLYKI